MSPIPFRPLAIPRWDTMSEKPLPFMETFSMNVISCSLYPPNHKHLPMEGCQFFQNPEGQAQVLSLVDCLCEFLSSILKILLQSYLEGLNNGSSITQKHKTSFHLPPNIQLVPRNFLGGGKMNSCSFLSMLLWMTLGTSSTHLPNTSKFMGGWLY